MKMPNIVPSASLRRARPGRSWTSLTAPIVIGKDILELLGSSMYIDPMSIYREYVQNAADAIDDARESALVDEGTVDFAIDVAARTVKIRDNGCGLAESDFLQRLTSFGASDKRGQQARGFRGIGRLGGIGYCQELIFRSRTKGEQFGNELRWDCKELKTLLREDSLGNLGEIVQQAVAHRRLAADDWPEHFFEVELRGIVRHRNDQLLDPVAIHTYLSQVGPVPFSPEFRYAEQIDASLSPQVKLGNLQIRISGCPDPVCRPHRNSVVLGSEISDEIKDLQFFTIPAVDGGAAAVGWVLHHGYTGALPLNTRIRGLRLRVGNIQIGDDRILEELFLEGRFNSWVVGEIHVLDKRVVPNGRRDHVEQNVHFHNLLTHILPIARELSRNCRQSSIRRNRSREFLRCVEAAQQKLSIVKQGALSRTEQGRLLREVHTGIAELEKLAERGLFEQAGHLNPRAHIRKLKRDVEKIERRQNIRSRLSQLPRARRQAYERIFSLIYECAQNRTSAKALVDRIIARLG